MTYTVPKATRTLIAKSISMPAVVVPVPGHTVNGQIVPLIPLPAGKYLRQGDSFLLVREEAVDPLPAGWIED